ncbi:MAG: serine protease, partial [Dolichospermum sp.]
VILMLYFFFLRKSVQDIAKETSVLIISSPPGSGVIIKRVDNKYYVLTTRHSVYRDGEYTIKTYDGQLHKVDSSKIDSKFDLAIVEFTSNINKTYSYAKLGNKITSGMNVYISGWKNCATPGYEFNKGKILELFSPLGRNSNTDIISLEDGYLTKYTNPTTDGMSGSPVFNDQGLVIAIHGKSERYKRNSFDYYKCPILDQYFSPNLGIPIGKFLTSELQSQLPFKVKAENSNPINLVTGLISNFSYNTKGETKPEPNSYPSILPSKNPDETLQNCVFCRPKKHQTP